MRYDTARIRTALFIEDEVDKGYTAFFNHKPGATAEGDNLPDALRNLANALEALERFEKERP